MERLARDFAEAETDELPSGPAMTAAIVRANRDRAARGLAPLHDDEVPEEGLYRRARALGLRRISS